MCRKKTYDRWVNSLSNDFENYRINAQLKAKYKITIEDYNKLKEASNNTCYVCSQPETRINQRTGKIDRLAVDHDHKTGKVRGLLCNKHNVALGLIDDNIEVLKKMIDYLNRS